MKGRHSSYHFAILMLGICHDDSPTANPVDIIFFMSLPRIGLVIRNVYVIFFFLVLKCQL